MKLKLEVRAEVRVKVKGRVEGSKKEGGGELGSKGEWKEGLRGDSGEGGTTTLESKTSIDEKKGKQAVSKFTFSK